MRQGDFTGAQKMGFQISFLAAFFRTRKVKTFTQNPKPGNMKYGPESAN
jgi:hypothetical protein